MSSRHILALAAAMTLTASGGLLPATASAATMQVNQGWKISTPSGGCTIGFNVPHEGLSYTAAHCGKAGDPVYLTDAQGQVYASPAGVLTPAQGWDIETISNDWAIIEWNPGVQVNANIFGDRIIPLQELALGETVCFHGQATHGLTGRAACGAFTGAVEESFHFDPSEPSRQGDSGGPVFVPGKGLIGVLSGDTEFEISGEIHRLERANTLNNGALLNWDEIRDFGSAYFDAQVTYEGLTTIDPPEGAQVPPGEGRIVPPKRETAAQGTPTESSDLGAIIGGVLGAIAVLALIGAAAAFNSGLLPF